jgi:hypothetical protein
MKKQIRNAVFAISILAGTNGCLSATASTVTEYNAEGKVVRITQNSESILKSVTESTKDKTCIVWESGWAAYISASAATTEDPTPTVKMGVGKVDKGAISLHKDHKELQNNLPAVIHATRDDLSVSVDGVTTKK